MNKKRHFFLIFLKMSGPVKRRTAQQPKQEPLLPKTETAPVFSCWHWWWSSTRTPEEEEFLEIKREIVRGDIIKVKADIARMEEQMEKSEKPGVDIEAHLYNAKRVLALVENELNRVFLFLPTQVTI